MKVYTIISNDNEGSEIENIYLQSKEGFHGAISEAKGHARYHDFGTSVYLEEITSEGRRTITRITHFDGQPF